MLSQSNQVHAKATERLFLAVVNQAISDVLENGKEAKEAERWLLSKDFDALDRMFISPAEVVGAWSFVAKRKFAKGLIHRKLFQKKSPAEASLRTALFSNH